MHYCKGVYLNLSFFSQIEQGIYVDLFHSLILGENALDSIPVTTFMVGAFMIRFPLADVALQTTTVDELTNVL